MNSKRVLVALAMVSALALTACGGAKSAPQPASTQPAATAAQSPLETGVAKLRQVLTDTQKAVAAADAAKAQSGAKAADEAWERFEDQAREKSKDLYAKIEDQLQLIAAATKASPVDTKVAGEAITKLSGLLDDLVAVKTDTTANAASGLKAGAAEMKHDLDGAQKAIAAGDVTKAQQEVAEADEAWAKFEDQVKEKNKDLYAKAEDQLHAIQAAVKASPLDAKTATAAIAKLNTYLDRVPALAGDIAAGVAWLKHEVEGTNAAAGAGDAVKARKEADEADQAWESFEDQVKAKNQDLYGKVEEQLQALRAAVKPDQIDTKLVSEIAGTLSSRLDDLLK